MEKKRQQEPSESKESKKKEKCRREDGVSSTSETRLRNENKIEAMQQEIV